MSKEKRIIEIVPGLKTPGGRMEEHFLSRGHVCTYCQTAIGNVTSRNAPCVKAAEDLMLW